jgi:predicted DCC family thiol-disulfide oxidoreductase YuxK
MAASPSRSSFESVNYRELPGLPAFPQDRPILIFDGHCVLCSRFARFILKHDRSAVFRLMPAQSALGQTLFQVLGLDPVRFETNVLLNQGRAWFKSEGTRRVFLALGFPWSVYGAVLRLLPRRLLDLLYDLIARNRLRWFGVREQCYVSDVDYSDRFLR